MLLALLSVKRLYILDSEEKRIIDEVNTTNTNGSGGVAYYFEMNVNHIQEKDLGWELTQSIVANTVAMLFVVIGAVIAFLLKKYIMKFFNKKEQDEDKDEPIKP
jgi:hypothetical protein